MFEIRQVRSPQGRKKLHAERKANLDLVAQGVGNAEACRIVGINRRIALEDTLRSSPTPEVGAGSEKPHRPVMLDAVAILTDPGGPVLAVQPRRSRGS